MTLAMGPRLGMLISGAPGEGHYLALLRSARLLDGLIQTSIKARVASLPGSPANGDMYLMTAGGSVGQLARYYVDSYMTPAAAWEYIPPKEGFAVWSEADGRVYRFRGGSWVPEDLLGVEVQVSAATTLVAAAFGRMHVCSGTTASYDVTLPAASGNVGRLLGFRMSPDLTEIVTLRGAGSDLIDGLAARPMWAEETALLYCTGTGWVKLAGRSVPMMCQMYPTEAVTLADSVITKIPLAGVVRDTTGKMADPTTNKRVNVIRGGTYFMQGLVYFQAGAQASYNTQARLHVNGTVAPLGTGGFLLDVPAARSFLSSVTAEVAVAAGDYVELYGYQSNGLGGSRQNYFGNVNHCLSLSEKITW